MKYLNNLISKPGRAIDIGANRGLYTHALFGNPQCQGAEEIAGFPVSQITDSSANTLLTLLSSNNCSSPILLHYVGYGYAKRCCPTWLVDGLQRWKSLYPQSNLVTMFHELYASGPPWTSSFWLSPLQKSLAARLTQLSDRLRRNQVLKSFQKLTKNGLKNTKNCTIDYNSN